jgi:hypothetical protein
MDVHRYNVDAYDLYYEYTNNMGGLRTVCARTHRPLHAVHDRVRTPARASFYPASCPPSLIHSLRSICDLGGILPARARRRLRERRPPSWAVTARCRCRPPVHTRRSLRQAARAVRTRRSQRQASPRIPALPKGGRARAAYNTLCGYPGHLLWLLHIAYLSFAAFAQHQLTHSGIHF